MIPGLSFFLIDLMKRKQTRAFRGHGLGFARVSARTGERAGFASDTDVMIVYTIDRASKWRIFNPI